MYDREQPWLFDRLPRRWLILASVCLLALGLALRWASLSYSGPLGPQPPGSTERSPQERFNDYAFSRFAYNDVLSLYYRDGLQLNPRPYIDYQLEYPVGIALFTYLLSFAGSPQAYYLLTYALMSLFSLATLLLLLREPGSRPAALALAPALVVHVGINWDMLALLPLVAALVLLRRERLMWAGVLLALSTWTKVFPVFFLPPLLAALAAERRWRDAAWLIGSFATISLLLNGPALLVGFERWFHFLTFQMTRRREVNIWSLVPSLPLEWVNRGVSLSMALVTLLSMAVVLRRRQGPALQAALWAGTALLIWFFFIGKVYSPQYTLWILALLALLAAPWPLVALVWVVDLVYFLYSFTVLGLTAYEGAAAWFYRYQLIPAMAVREALLFGLVLWAFWRAARLGGQEMRYARAA